MATAKTTLPTTPHKRPRIRQHRDLLVDPRYKPKREASNRKQRLASQLLEMSNIEMKDYYNNEC